MSWGLSGSWLSRDTRSGEVLTEIFSSLENKAILAFDLLR